MIPVTDEVLAEMVRAIVCEVASERVYVFGSRARGDARAESDVDLLVVTDRPLPDGQSRLRETERIRRALSPYRVPKDILVYRVDEVERWKHSLNHVVGRCLREGKVLYARSCFCLHWRRKT